MVLNRRATLHLTFLLLAVLTAALACRSGETAVESTLAAAVPGSPVLCPETETGPAFASFPRRPLGDEVLEKSVKAMEQVAVGKMTEYSRYGSNQQKRMFIYGRLDFGPTTLTPSYGFGWTLSGWLLTPFLQTAGMETVMRMRKRVLDNLTTTFASGYKTKVDLEGMLTKDAILDYRQMKTGEKYLVMPHG